MPARFRLAKQQLCKCITLFCTFVCRYCTTTTWKCLISRFVGNVNTRQRLFDTPLEFNCRKICQHLTNWTRWNKRDKIWNRANWLFKWRFRSRRRRFCLYSLLWEAVAYKNWTTGATFKEEVQALIMEDSQFVQFRSYAMCGSTLLLRAFSYIVSSKVHKATIEIR